MSGITQKNRESGKTVLWEFLQKVLKPTKFRERCEKISMSISKDATAQTAFLRADVNPPLFLKVSITDIITSAVACATTSLATDVK